MYPQVNVKFAPPGTSPAVFVPTNVAKRFSFAKLATISAPLRAYSLMRMTMRLWKSCGPSVVRDSSRRAVGHGFRCGLSLHHLLVLQIALVIARHFRPLQFRPGRLAFQHNAERAQEPAEQVDEYRDI
jgi:hypothetical protein